MILSEAVLQFARENYFQPARLNGQKVVEVKAGEIHSALRWSRRVPLVCSALSSQKFQKAAGVRLIETKDAPPSGLSTRTIYRYEILDVGEPSVIRPEAPVPPKRGVLAAYGVAAQLYRQVGGGDAFIASERANFGSAVPETGAPSEQAEASGHTHP